MLSVQLSTIPTRQRQKLSKERASGAKPRLYRSAALVQHVDPTAGIILNRKVTLSHVVENVGKRQGRKRKENADGDPCRHVARVLPI